jgi:hypothetical protein
MFAPTISSDFGFLLEPERIPQGLYKETLIFSSFSNITPDLEKSELYPQKLQ